MGLKQLAGQRVRSTEKSKIGGAAKAGSKLWNYTTHNLGQVSYSWKSLVVVAASVVMVFCCYNVSSSSSDRRSQQFPAFQLNKTSNSTADPTAVLHLSANPSEDTANFSEEDTANLGQLDALQQTPTQMSRSTSAAQEEDLALVGSKAISEEEKEAEEDDSKSGTTNVLSHQQRQEEQPEDSGASEPDADSFEQGTVLVSKLPLRESASTVEDDEQAAAAHDDHHRLQVVFHQRTSDEEADADDEPAADLATSQQQFNNSSTVRRDQSRTTAQANVDVITTSQDEDEQQLDSEDDQSLSRNSTASSQKKEEAEEEEESSKEVEEEEDEESKTLPGILQAGSSESSKSKEAERSVDQIVEKESPASRRDDDDSGIVVPELDGEKSAAADDDDDTSSSRGGFSASCDISQGRWVYDESYPLYRAPNCPFLDPGFRCEQNGRPNLDYMKYRWQPHDCDLPRFNATDMLERIRNQRMVFVGDSLGRNHWESTMCMLAEAVADKSRIYEINGEPISKHQGFLSFRFQDYNCTVEYYRSPFLVPQSRPPPHSPKAAHCALRVDSVFTSPGTSWKDADILVLNAGHWWTKHKIFDQQCYFQEGDKLNMDVTLETGFQKALQTWGKWMEKNLDTEKTHVIFRSFSPVHFRGGAWNTGGHCHQETHPMTEEEVKAEKSVPPWTNAIIFNEIEKSQKKDIISYLDITTSSNYRSDGHGALYQKNYTLVPTPRNKQDCSHFCLPGVPDTWSELMFATLLARGKRDWRKPISGLN